MADVYWERFLLASQVALRLVPKLALIFIISMVIVELLYRKAEAEKRKEQKSEKSVEYNKKMRKAG